MEEVREGQKSVSILHIGREILQPTLTPVFVVASGSPSFSIEFLPRPTTYTIFSKLLFYCALTTKRPINLPITSSLVVTNK